MTGIVQRHRRFTRIEDIDDGIAVVKSAVRVLSILEFFDDVQREATVVEVANALAYPQSSTSALLRSLTKLGYLSHDARRRTFIPSKRVALLGHWIDPEVVQEGPLISMMKTLAVETGHVVILAARRGLFSQYVHVIQAASPPTLHLTVGTLRPIAASGTGYALLSTLSNMEITRLVNRINAEAEHESGRVKLRDVLHVVEETRRLGYNYASDVVTPGAGVVSMILPPHGPEPAYAIAIGGVADAVERARDELVALMRREIDLLSTRLAFTGAPAWPAPPAA